MVKEVTRYESKRGETFDTQEDAAFDDLVGDLQHEFERLFDDPNGSIHDHMQYIKDGIAFGRLCYDIARQNPRRAERLLGYMRAIV
jgi:hypothetical protein